MTTFTITFRTAAEIADHELEADTPQQALERALVLWETNRTRLWFTSYDGLSPLETITVEADDDSTPLEWMAPSARLAFAAGALRDALEQAVAALNTAPRFRVPDLSTDSYRIAAICDAALRQARGGQA